MYLAHICLLQTIGMRGSKISLKGGILKSAPPPLLQQSLDLYETINKDKREGELQK